MLELRPIVIDENNIVLGGNMRLKACQELGLKDVPTIYAKDLTEDQKKEFIIKDNVGFGEWNWDDLANDWDETKLVEWDLDLPLGKEVSEEDLFDINIPIYTPSTIQPEITELANLDKTKSLIDKINLLDIPENLKEILKIRASFLQILIFKK
jgi:hypothetical protein